MTDITQESLQKKQEAIDLLAKRTVRRIVELVEKNMNLLKQAV